MSSTSAKKRFLACTRCFLLPAALRQRDLKGDDAAFAASADAPVMAGHDGLGGGQSNAAPAGRAGTGGVRTVKAVKIVGQLRGIYSGTGVGERQLHAFSPRKGRKMDRSTRVTVFHSIVQQDRQQATQTARAMVTQYGFSDKLGLVNYGSDDDEVFIGRDLAHTKSYGEGVASVIDEEVKSIIDDPATKKHL